MTLLQQRNFLYFAMVKAISTLKGEDKPSTETMENAYSLAKRAYNLAIDKWFENQ